MCMRMCVCVCNSHFSSILGKISVYVYRINSCMFVCKCICICVCVSYIHICDSVCSGILGKISVYVQWLHIFCMYIYENICVCALYKCVWFRLLWHSRQDLCVYTRRSYMFVCIYKYICMCAVYTCVWFQLL